MPDRSQFVCCPFPACFGLVGQLATVAGLDKSKVIESIATEAIGIGSPLGSGLLNTVSWLSGAKLGEAHGTTAAPL